MMNWGRHIQNSNTFDTDMEVITVRNARKEDASDVAWLIMMAWPVEEFLAMDESLTEESLHERIQSYVEADDTLYSYRNTIVAVCGDRICGAINGYDGARYEDLKRPITEDFSVRYPNAQNDFSLVHETEAGEYYLDSIGVDPSMRSHGIGSRLFKAAIDRAAKEGFTRAGLIVDVDKPKAEALYIRLGFKTVGMKDFFGHPMKHMQIEVR